jgi:hypothetical protein
VLEADVVRRVKRMKHDKMEHVTSLSRVASAPAISSEPELATMSLGHPLP